MFHVRVRCDVIPNAIEFSGGYYDLSYLHLAMIAHHLLTHLAIERSGEQAVLQGRDALRLPGVERMQSVLRGLIFDDCVSSLTTSKKDKALGRKIKKMIVPAE